MEHITVPRFAYLIMSCGSWDTKYTNLMRELIKELKEALLGYVKGSYIYGIISPQRVNENNSKYDWIELLKSVKWKETNYDDKTINANNKKVRFIKNLELLPYSISAKRPTPLLSVCGIVFSDRSEVKKKILDHYEYDNMSKQKSEFDYYINIDNLDKVFYDSSNRLMETYRKLDDTFNIVFSVSTVTDKNIPDCPECNGNGHNHCPECDSTGKIVCEHCSGNGFLLCENCEGVGEIQYNAGNYANGEPRIKTKICPICEGKGKIYCNNCNGKGEKNCKKCHGEGEVICEKCHGSGKKVNGPIMREVQYFEDHYYFEKEVLLNVVTDNNPDSEKFEFKKKIKNNEKRKVEGILSMIDFNVTEEWLHSLQVSQLYQAPGKIIIDNKKQIGDELFALGDEYKILYDNIQEKILHIEKEHSKEDVNTVCVLEKHFTISPITVISVHYTDFDGSRSEIEFYVWENLIWCDCYEELIFWKLLSLKIKKVIS